MRIVSCTNLAEGKFLAEKLQHGWLFLLRTTYTVQGTSAHDARNLETFTIANSVLSWYNSEYDITID